LLILAFYNADRCFVLKIVFIVKRCVPEVDCDISIMNIEDWPIDWSRKILNGPISATDHPIHLMFCSRVGLPWSADRTAVKPNANFWNKLIQISEFQPLQPTVW